MKKSFLIIGLFSLMMILTSFNTPNETGGKNNGTGTDSGTGQFDTGGKNNGTGTDSGTGQYDTGGKNNGTGTDSGTGQ